MNKSQYYRSILMLFALLASITREGVAAEPGSPPAPPKGLTISSEPGSPTPPLDPPGSDSLLSGMTPNNYNVPSGWVVVRTQDFESSIHPTEACCGASASITTTKPHTGSKSIEGLYDDDQDQVRWLLREGQTGDFNEIYLSFYEWTDSFAEFNDEYYLGKFEVTNPFAEIVIEAAYWSNGFNQTSSNMYVACQGTEGDCTSTWLKFHDPAEGAWIQWEIHFRPNTTGQSNGFLRIYKNGNLFASKENYVFNGPRSFNGAQVEVGGIYTKVAWMSGFPPNCPTSTCTSAPGEGSDYCYATYYRNQTFAHPTCEPKDPPLPAFKRFFDDIILMKR